MTASRILLVDDDVELIDILGSYIEREGFEVATTSSAEAAWPRRCPAMFTSVVLDVMMPGMQRRGAGSNPQDQSHPGADADGERR